MAEKFAQERDWEQFHSVRNLLLALISEVGELAEVVRWAGDTDPPLDNSNHQDWTDEIGDVFILLVRLADRSGVDLTAAFEQKLKKAGLKYPAEEFRGCSRKA
jgi:dCTP diphosphatase